MREVGGVQGSRLHGGSQAQWHVVNSLQLLTQNVATCSGTCGTKTVPDQHWNDDLLSAVAADLDPVFERLHNQVCAEFATDVATRVGEALEKLKNALKGKSCYTWHLRYILALLQWTLPPRSLVPLWLSIIT